MRKICEATNWVLAVIIDATVTLYLALILLMTVNPSINILVTITAHIGGWYSQLPIPHNVLIPDLGLGFSTLITWNVIVLVRGVNLLDRLENLVKHSRKTKKLSSKLVGHHHNS